MRAMLFATSTLGALALGIAPALAQSSGGSTSGGSAGQATTSSSTQTVQTGIASPGTPKPMTQERVRQVMKEAGFTNVSILDAAYFVQATTKDGDQVLVMLNAPTVQAAAGQTGGGPGTPGASPPSQTSVAGSTSGASQLLAASPHRTTTMEELLEAAQKLRESIQALAQQPAGPKRQAAIEAAREALLLTQRAMLQLPPELRSEGLEVHDASAWQKAMARLTGAERDLGQSIEAISKHAAGKARNEALATVNKALAEAQQAILALPDSGAR